MRERRHFGVKIGWVNEFDASFFIFRSIARSTAAAAARAINNRATGAKGNREEWKSVVKWSEERRRNRRRSFLLEIYLIACSVSASLDIFGVHTVHHAVNMLCMAFPNSEVLTSPHVNYKFYLFIFLRHFSSTSTYVSLAAAVCWRARNERTASMTYATGHDVHLEMCERRSRKWVAKCDNCLFYSVFIDDFFSASALGLVCGLFSWLAVCSAAAPFMPDSKNQN